MVCQYNIIRRKNISLTILLAKITSRIVRAVPSTSTYMRFIYIVSSPLWEIIIFGIEWLSSNIEGPKVQALLT